MLRAYFVADNLFQKKFGDLGRLATELTGTKKQKFISFMKNIFTKFKNAFNGIGKLEKEFLRMEYCADSMEAATEEENNEKSNDNSSSKGSVDVKSVMRKMLGVKDSSANTEDSSTSLRMTSSEDSSVVAQNDDAGASAQGFAKTDGLDSNSGLVANDVDNSSKNVYNENTNRTSVVSGNSVNGIDVVKNTMSRNHKLAQARESAKSEVAENDLTEHVDDKHYTDVYNKYVNVDESNPSTVKDGPPSLNRDGLSVEERANEFNRIYEYGVEEEISPKNIKSKIFSDAQIREIYAAGVVDSNLKFGQETNFDEVLAELEQQATIDKFGADVVNGILSMSAQDIQQASNKIGVNVKFADKVPGPDPNANGYYDRATKTIYINNNSRYPFQQVFLHELTHFFESADGFNDFQKTVFESKAFKRWLNTYTNIKKGTYKTVDEFRNYLLDIYETDDTNLVDKEMVAYFVADNLFQKKFGDLGRLATELTGTKKQKFISFMKNIFAKFKNIFNGIGKLEKEFLKLYDSASYQQIKNTDQKGGAYMKEVDSYEKSSNSKLLEERRISAFSGSENNLRKQSSNSKKMAEYVELFSGSNGKSGEILAGESGFLRMEKRISDYTGATWGKRRHFESYVRNLSGVKLQEKDTVGRLLPKFVLENFQNTVFKNEKGHLLSLYHWTNAVFKEFGKGDVGFHFGTLDSASNLAFDKRNKQPNNKISIFKETYINVSNPIFIYSDVHYWDSLPFIDLLLKNNYITNEEVDSLCDGNWQNFIGKHYGDKIVDKIVDYLEQKGYDGVVYENEVEGDYSVIAFHPEQIYTVAENGIDIKHEAELKDSAFSNGENTDGSYMKELDPEGFQDSGEYFYEDENGELTWMNAEDTQRYLRKNKKFAVLDKRQVELKAKALLKQYQSRMDSEEVASSLFGIYEDIKNIDDSGNHARPKVEAIANKIFENIVEKVAKGEMYDELRDFFKTKYNLR